MKKLLSLLSILTISGTAIPTTIAASSYQKEENINSNINYQQTNNLESLNRNKRESQYPKEKIEFLNNDFFYKFNVNLDFYKTGPVSSGKKDGDDGDLDYKKDIVIIENWKKYANSWEEFQSKFPKIEFTNIKIAAGGQLRGEKNSFTMLTNLEKQNIITVKEKFLVRNQRIDIDVRLKIDGNKLILENIFYLQSSNALDRTWAHIKYDGVRLVGEIDVNPLLNLTTEKTKQFDIWASSKEKELKDKKEDPNYNKNNLLNEENSFKEEFKLWLIQIRHDYIQDLIIISQDNEIKNLKLEIENIKSMIEKPKTCLDNIFDSFKKNALSNASSDAWKSIQENSDSPLKNIVKKSGKAFASGLIKGIAKGSALGIISCVVESIL